MKGWGDISIEEKVERLRKMLILVMLAVVVVFVMLGVVMLSTIVDESPSKPQKQEHTVNNNEAGGI